MDDSLHEAYEQSRVYVPFFVSKDTNANYTERYVVEDERNGEIVYRTSTYASASIKAGNLNVDWYLRHGKRINDV